MILFSDCPSTNFDVVFRFTPAEAKEILRFLQSVPNLPPTLVRVYLYLLRTSIAHGEDEMYG